MSGEKKAFIGIGLVTLLILIGGVFFISKSDTNNSNNPSNNTTTLSSEQKKLLDVVPDDYFKGNKNANVTIVEYLDFECEACGAYYPLVKQMADEYKNDIRIVNRYYPLMGHKNGLPSAWAVEAAAKQGKYWEMHDVLFENQKSWGERPTADPKIFEEYATQIGLNLEQFKNDVASKEVKERVQRDMSSGQQLGVNGTPTFFLNGEKIPNPKSAEDFRSFIQAAILKSPKSSNQSSSAPIKEFTMTAKQFDFTPSTITVSEGDKVKLTVTAEDVPHGFAIDELDIQQDLEVGKPTTIEFTANKKGTFRFYCSLFCGQGHKEMEGQLIVE